MRGGQGMFGSLCTALGTAEMLARQMFQIARRWMKVVRVVEKVSQCMLFYRAVR